jgi:hypothetical protein
MFNNNYYFNQSNFLVCNSKKEKDESEDEKKPEVEPPNPDQKRKVKFSEEDFKK